MGDAAKLWAREARVASGTERAVLMWIGELERGGEMHEGMAAIARALNLPERNVLRAGVALEKAGYITKIYRGRYLLNMLPEPTSASIEPTIPEPTSESVEPTSASVLVRADLNKNNNKSGEGQVQLFDEPEWVGSFNAVPWVKRLITIKQRVTIETNHDGVNLDEQVSFWHDWHDAKKGKPKSPYTSFSNWLRIAKDGSHATGTGRGARQLNELAQINRAGRSGGYADPERYG